MLAALTVMLAMLLVLFAPVEVRARVSYAGRFQGSVGWTIFHIPLPAIRLGQGKKTGKKQKVYSARQKKRALAAAKRVGIVKRIFRHWRLQHLTLRASIFTDDAARTALLSGAAGSLAQALPASWRMRSDIRILPDFFSGESKMAGTCIVSSRLGRIGADAALLLAAYILQARAESKEE